MNDEEKINRQLTFRTPGDLGHLIARAPLGSVPVVGGALQEVFNELVMRPFARRDLEWRTCIAEDIEQLKANGIQIDHLEDNDQFTTIVAQATRAAMRCHESEKLEALRSAVLNTALRCPVEDALQQMFINMVDDFTVWHLRLLKLWQDPRAWFANNGRDTPKLRDGATRMVLIELAYPELAEQLDLVQLIARDFNARRLGPADVDSTGYTSDLLFSPATTAFGNRFLAYVTRPSEFPRA